MGAIGQRFAEEHGKFLAENNPSILKELKRQGDLERIPTKIFVRIKLRFRQARPFVPRTSDANARLPAWLLPAQRDRSRPREPFSPGAPMGAVSWLSSSESPAVLVNSNPAKCPPLGAHSNRGQI
jgi:hypothetical protein